MGFLTGRASFIRFRVEGASPRIFGPEHLEALAARKVGSARVATADGSDAGWTAGTHVLDVDFRPEKNVVDDRLLFELRIDKDQLPGELLKAYYETELKAMSKDNPSGKPSTKQKREAKASARERLESEAKDGRFRKRRTTPALWDRHAGEVWLGTSSLTVMDRFSALFHATFDLELDAMPAGRQAHALAEVGGRTRAVDDAKLSLFTPATPECPAWVVDDSVKDWLGNEFLLWLWYFADVEGDTVKVEGGDEVVFMFSGGLTLDCPQGQHGYDTFKHAAPCRLPEAKRAAQAGKLPRKCGLTLVRNGEQYELALSAELLALTGVKISPPDEDTKEPLAVQTDRLNKLRDLAETLDLLYAAFLDRRLSDKWGTELAAMQKWLGRTKGHEPVA